ADFVVQYLTRMSKDSNFPDFRRALPVLGRDGTLAKIQVRSPAANHVYAKTGTFFVEDALNKNILVTGKGLAGYIDTATGDHLAFASYANMVSIPDPEAAAATVGEALGEIASAAYDAPSGTKVSDANREAYDVIIKGGRVVDGSGNPWFMGDVAIKGDRIAAVGHLGNAPASRVIDATGMVVAPGF